LEDKSKLLPLPRELFNSDKYLKVKVNPYGRFTLNKGMHEYSGVPKLVEEYANIRITANFVHVLDRNFKELVVHERLYGDSRLSSIKWLPFLNQLALKPNAIKYSGIMETLPDPLKRYMEINDPQERSKVLTTIAKISEDAGFDKALEVTSEAARLEVLDSDSLLSIYAYQSMANLEFKEVRIPEGLPNMNKVVPVINDFDAYLAKGGAAIYYI